MPINRITLIICSLIVCLGFLGAGYSIGKGFYMVKKLGRSVSVKGLAEQDVKSDLGIWEINYRELGSDLIKVNEKLQQDEQLVKAFLKEKGFKDEEIDRTQLKVEDRLANIYNQQTTTTTNDPRYVVTGGVRVRSKNVDLIKQMEQTVDKFLQQGIPLTFDASSLTPNPSYYYTNLDNIRPAMLATATKSARVIAEQFAKDSDSHLVGILRASQGVFQIMGRDTSTMSADWNSNQNALGSIEKKVRLVTTIEYRIR